jgi:M6 family metalloprotease-like protein
VALRPLVFVAALAALSLLPLVSGAQEPLAPPRVRRERPGFDFRQDGVWRRQARAVRAMRARLLSRRQFGALNAPMASGARAPLASTAAVSGVLRVPALVFRFRDTPPTQTRAAAEYDQVLFSSTPPSGRPYTYRTYYEQLSNGLLSVQGKTYGSVALDSNEITYAGSPPCPGNLYGTDNCNGYWSADALSRMQNGLRETVRKLDSQVDWRQYDADGDGYVDLVVFIQAELDGACVSATNNHLWAHRWTLQTPYVTHSKNSLGISIKVADYVLQSAVGGGAGCDASQIMPIGTVAHETGHGFGLPDLYDTDDSSEGVGEFSLMGSGTFTSDLSPARMDAWSLNELGWVTVVPLPGPGTYSFGAAPTSDTALFLPALGSNPRGEYFLLENRQAVQADTAMIRFHCRVSVFPSPPPAGCGGGLLIWHVDSAQLVNGMTTPGPNSDFNHVNVGPIHGLALVQADGLGNLDVNSSASCFTQAAGCSNRGDAGDPYPGLNVGNTAFTPTSVPAAVRNADGQPAGFVLDQITQVAPNGAMSFRLMYPVWVVRAAPDTAAFIAFDGVSYHVFRGILAQGSTHTVSVADTQFTLAGRTRQVFVSWSDGQPRSHTYTAGSLPETLTVTLARSHRLDYSATNGGTVAADTAGSPVTTGSFVAEGTDVTLTATAGSLPFISWVGDTVSKSMTITLPMGRPYSVRAAFLAPLNTADVVSQLLDGTGLTPQQQLDLDQLGNNNGAFDLGDFLAWAQATGAPLSAEQRGLVGVPKRRGAPR